jgi:hypothetical protein
MLRFPPSFPALLRHDVEGLDFFGIMRRLYPATTRNDLFNADIQIAGRPRTFDTREDSAFRHYGPTKFELVAAIHAILKGQATVRSADGSVRKQPIALLGSPLAHALDAATTVGRPTGNVAAGALAIVVEVEEKISPISTWRAKWETSEGLNLAGRTIVFNGRSINVFVVERGRRADRYRARELRIHLLRLHAEREYLRRIAKLLAVEDFVDRCEHVQIERIQGALNQSLRTLTRIRGHGFSTPEITAAFAADRTLSGSELETLAERVSTFRPVIQKRLQELKQLEDTVEVRWRELLNQAPSNRNVIYIREASVSSYDQRGSQIGAAGANAFASNFSFGDQLNLQTMSSTETESLQAALRTLRKHLAEQLLHDSQMEVGDEEITATEIGNAIGALSEAENAITVKDDQRAADALRRCGRWLAVFAQGIGVEIAAAAIRAALRLP